MKWITCFITAVLLSIGSVQSAPPARRPVPSPTPSVSPPALKVPTPETRPMPRYPGTGFDRLLDENQGLRNHTELDLAIAAGNNSAQNYGILHSTRLRYGANKFQVHGSYNLGMARGKKEAEDWYGLYRYDRYLTPRLSLFIGNKWEGNEFAGYDFRTYLFAGPRYVLYHSDTWNIAAEAAYAFLHEARTNNTSDNRHYARGFLEAAMAINPSNAVYASAEVLKGITRGADLLMNFEVALVSSLSDTFSIRLGALGRYNNDPPPTVNHKMDYWLRTGLSANY